MWLRREWWMVDGIDREGGTTGGVRSISPAHIDISCLANVAACVSLALDSVNVAPSTHHLQPTTARQADPRLKGAVLTTDYKLRDFARSRLPFPFFLNSCQLTTKHYLTADSRYLS